MSALQGTGILDEDKSNYFSFLARKDFEGQYPNPSEMILGSSHTFIVDSRERNKAAYPNPAQYKVKIEPPFKNVTSIELKGSLIPKTEGNVNSDNRYIPFNVVDYITNARIKEKGFGYVNGVYDSSITSEVAITSPALSGGTQAEITVTVINNEIVSVVITPGSEGTGYLRGSYGGIIDDSTNGFYKDAGASFINNIPRDNTLRDRWKNADIEIQVGHELVAVLRPGMYDFASPNDDSEGLAREITTALQDAVQDALDQGVITPIVGGPTTGAEYFPYGAADTGSTFLTTINENASGNASVVIQRGDDGGGYTQYPFLELLFGSSTLKCTTAVNLLGYGSNTTIVAGKFPPMDQTSGSFTFGGGGWSSIPIISRNDYNLTDSPKYVILEITPLQDTRIQSPSAQLNKGFALLAFDANLPDVIFREPNTGGAGTGDSSYTTLLAKPGVLKGIKGQDFDSKMLSFGSSPVAELSEFFVEFKTYGGNYYNFQGEDHTLIFQIGANDINNTRY